MEVRIEFIKDWQSFRAGNKRLVRKQIADLTIELGVAKLMNETKPKAVVKEVAKEPTTATKKKSTKK
jgi:hypothetical protein